MKIKAFVILIMTAVLLLSGCTATDSDVPAGMQLLSNEHVTYTAYVPDTWVVNKPTEATATPYAYVGSNDASSVSIVANDLTADQMDKTLEELWDSYKADFEANMPDMKYVGEPVKTTLDKKPATQYVYTATIAGTRYKYQQTLCVEEGTLYIITYTSTEDFYDENLDDVEQIIKTFKF